MTTGSHACMRFYCARAVTYVIPETRTEDMTYVIPETRTEALQIAKFERNNKAVNMLFSALGTAEYQPVQHLQMTREIWTTLSEHHEGTAPVKAWLF